MKKVAENSTRESTVAHVVQRNMRALVVSLARCVPAREACDKASSEELDAALGLPNCSLSDFQ